MVMVSNEEVPLRQAAEEFAVAYGVQTYPVCMDLAVPDAAKRLHEFCRERGMVVDVLVNNAGAMTKAPFLDMDASRDNADIALSLFRRGYEIQGEGVYS